MERSDTTGPRLRVEPARPDDIQDIARLWCDAFPGDRSVTERVRMLESGGRYGGIETVLAAREAGGELAGACKIYRMEEYIAGAALPMMGLAAVAVAPAFRRKGYGARLCVEAIHAAADRGDVVSVLYPFRPAYYERLGWGLVGSLWEHRFRTSDLEAPGADGAARVRPASLEEDGAAISGCYHRVARHANGPVRRDEAVWRYRLLGEELGVRPLADGALRRAEGDPRLRAVVYDDDGVTGYALLRYVRKPTPEQHTLHVRELIAETEEAYRGLLAHLASQHDQWPLALHYARPGERFGDRLREPRPPGYRPARSLYFPTARVVRGPMLRVLDVPAALRRRPLAGGPVHFGLTVRDPERPENDGPWTVRQEREGGVEVTPGAPPPGSPTLEADAATFARIFVGEIAASDAALLGRARVGGDVAAVDRALAAGPFWLLDEF